MKTSIIVCSVLLDFVCSVSAADEYLIRVEAVGYEDAIVGEKLPEETVVRTIEVLAQPNKPFRTKVRQGPQTLLLEGKLTPEDDGSFSMNIKYLHEIDTGDTVPTADGNQESVMSRTMTSSRTTITLDKAITIGGFETHAAEEFIDKKVSKASKLHLVLTVTRHKPLED